jgi:organic hydroperoxide reductase OsmC/OhrA
VAAVASCYVATFFALADLAKLEFIGLQLAAAGNLRTQNGRLQFTEIALRPILEIASETDRELATRLLAKAHKGCLIARSLACPVSLESFVQTAHEVFAR